VVAMVSPCCELLLLSHLSYLCSISQLLDEAILS
jgi:hypothetical protein